MSGDMIAACSFFAQKFYIFLKFFEKGTKNHAVMI